MLRAFWVVVVLADRTDVLTRLRRLLATASWVQIVVDRRRGDRRRAALPRSLVEPDRRRSDRRGAARDAPRAAYRVIQAAEGYHVLQSQSRAAAPCPECGATVEFDMPRLTQLPAQLTVTVLHPVGTPGGSHHVVETQARRASGRPFLASRVVARRRSAVG